MADKTQLIRIKYVTDNASLDQSAGAARRAQAATDQLRASAQKVGTDATQANKQWQGSIGTVRVEMERMKALIEVTSRSDTKLLNERIAKYKQLRGEVTAFNKQLQETNTVVKENTNSFGALRDIVSLVFSVAAVRQIANTALELAKIAGNVEGVSRAFQRLPNSTLLLDSLRRSTHGTVGELELMQKALQANNFKIPLEQLGVLFEFAATKAQQTGQEVNHLVDYIVSGIGYRSIKRLDDLGFTANRVKAALGGVSLQAATTGQVMNAVTTLMNEDLQKTGGYTETAATKVEQLGVAWKKFKEEVATATSKDGGFVDFLKDIVEGARLLTQGKRGTILEGINEESIKLAREFTEAIAGKDLPARIEDTQQKMNSLQQTIGQYNDMIRDAKRDAALGDGFGLPGFSEKNLAGAQRWNEVVQEYGKRAHDIFTREVEDSKKRLTSLQVNKKVLEETIIILKQYFATLEQAPVVEESLGLIEAKLAQIEEAGDRLKAAQTVGEIHSINNELSRLNGELADLKAFGTTKQFLEVEGRVKLVPVTDPKGFQKVLEQEPIFKEGIRVPIILEGQATFTFGTRSGADGGAGTAGGSLNEQIEAQIQAALRNIPPIKAPVNIEIVPMTDMERIGQEFSDEWRNILSQGLSDTGNFLSAVVQASADEYDQRLNQARAYYDELLILAGDNENQKDRIRLKSQKEELKLRREAFEADKRAKRSQALINGAVGITNAFATLPYPAAIVASALIAASTIAQVSAINQQKPRFAKGKVNIDGPGTRTSDSIDAKISRGESVINASSTQRSMKLLEGINSGNIDDRILSRLHLTQTGVKVERMDDTRIVNAIKSQKTPDLRRIGSVLQEVHTAQDGFSKRVRRKSMSS